MNITAKGGDGLTIENADTYALSTIVTIKLPNKIAKELGCLNPATGIIMAVDEKALHVQILPDSHPELKIPHKFIDNYDCEKNTYQIASTGKKILNSERYVALNLKSRDLEYSSKELAQVLINDPEAIQDWRESVYLQHSRAQKSFHELAQATLAWLKTQSWFQPSEQFHLPHIVNALLGNIFNLDLDS